jgi:transcriptional regulator with XRE-family HTH domain
MSQLDVRAGEVLRRKREDAGMSQAEMADETGISQQLISRTELGSRRITLATLRAFARALGLKVSDLAREICRENP